LDNKKAAIIIPCRNENIRPKQTVDFMLRTEARGKTPIIVIDDGSKDRSCYFLRQKNKDYKDIVLITTEGIGASGARNLGAESAEGAEILIFCDGHIIMQKGWLHTLLETFHNPEVSAVCPGIGPFDPHRRAGYGQTWDNSLEIKWLERPSGIQEVPLAPGACLAIRKSAFDAVHGFDRGFNSWGYEDVEISLKLWLFGYKIFVNPWVKIGHHFRKVPPYQVNPVDFHYNRVRMAVSHFNQDRIARIIEALGDRRHTARTLTKIILSDSLEQRNKYLYQRTYDDDWFFAKFNIPF
jgi:GT2 family glycosyltransferase